ncbi:hypothetical protein RJ640_003120 [Escallonia rubra]|uniref:TIR domain-containing protein n=1 Tax=Escallonia rubra TaxID=112253 RepID=A0AA88QV25_9ASTE|nr:hypothetical protein RJ640_003120 [Escallonia rubra]
MVEEFDVASSKGPLLFMASAGGQEASSSTSQCTNTSAYDVFLSFRGEDIRKTFLDHLYTALFGAGFHTFRDDDEIERAENVEAELEKAIQQSRSSIVVFSENYASSRWCLDELVMIVDRRRRTSEFVLLPVFYHVDPSHVRNQTGSLAAAFAGHEDRFKKERIRGWREALREVADLAGMVLQNQADGHEAKFIQEIVKVIENRVNHRVLDLPSNLVGMDSQVKDINSWLQDGSSDAEIMVLCGMGGIGKTTIARYVFNLHHSKFDSSSFLTDIRETFEKSDGPNNLQRQLLADISKRKETETFGVNDGINKIKHAMSHKKVLLVFDDVDQEEQLEAILGMQDWFYPHSKVIITTRHARLLTARASKLKIHNVDKLDNNESLRLFSRYAFRQDHPNEFLVLLSEEVVGQCEGLPLALKVLGSSFYERSIDAWQSLLAQLQAIPKNRILRKLEISYDSLEDDHDRNLFLEVACFFVGEDKDHMVTILDECEVHTIIGVQNLMDRCLLRVDEYNRVMMHQMLRDMGREIIRRESPKDPGNRSRLWHHKESFSVLKDNSGTGNIEGLALDMRMLKEDKTVSCMNSARPGRFSFFSWPVVNHTSNNSDEMDLKADAFSRMCRLRLLHINYLHLTGGFKGFPKKIKWLRWHGCPLKSIPSDFPLESMVAIDMSYSKLGPGWCGDKLLGCLKILDLSHCHGLTRTPDFSRFPILERLILKGCESLIEVHESIGNLENSLVYFNLEDCTSLRKLPRNTAMLKVLKALIISGCLNLDEFPRGMEKLEALRVFHADSIVMGPVVCEACGLMSIFYPGSQVPAWFSTRIKGSSLSFSVPSGPHTSIGGLKMCIVCFVYSMKEQDHEQFYAIVSNKTKDLKLIYGPTCYGCPKPNEDMRWVSYWMLGNDKLEAGDELTISLLSTKAVEAREIGFHLVNPRLEEEADGVEVNQPGYPSWDPYPEQFVGHSGSTRLFGQGTLRKALKDLLKDIGVTWDPCGAAEFEFYSFPASHAHWRSAGDQNLELAHKS